MAPPPKRVEASDKAKQPASPAPASRGPAWGVHGNPALSNSQTNLLLSGSAQAVPELRFEPWVPQELQDRITSGYLNKTLVFGVYREPYVWPDGGFKSHLIIQVSTPGIGQNVQIYREYPDDIAFFLKYTRGDEEAAETLRQKWVRRNEDMWRFVSGALDREKAEPLGPTTAQRLPSALQPFYPAPLASAFGVLPETAPTYSGTWTPEMAEGEFEAIDRTVFNSLFVSMAQVLTLGASATATMSGMRSPAPSGTRLEPGQYMAAARQRNAGRITFDPLIENLLKSREGRAASRFPGSTPVTYSYTPPVWNAATGTYVSVAQISTGRIVQLALDPRTGDGTITDLTTGEVQAVVGARLPPPRTGLPPGASAPAAPSAPAAAQGAPGVASLAAGPGGAPRMASKEGAAPLAAGTAPGAPRRIQMPSATIDPAQKQVWVWANPDSRVYHLEGSYRYTAGTKAGSRMTLEMAESLGYRPAGSPAVAPSSQLSTPSAAGSSSPGWVAVQRAAVQDSMAHWAGVDTPSAFARHSQSFGSLSRTMANKRDELAGLGQAGLLPNVDDAVLQRPVDLFIEESDRLRSLWARLSAQDRVQFEGEIGGRIVGNRVPDIVEFLLDRGLIVITDITLDPLSPLHFFKTEFYVEVMLHLLGGAGPMVRGEDINPARMIPLSRVHR